MTRLISLAILLLVSVLQLHAAERKPALWAVYYAWYHSGGKSSMWTVDGTAQPRSKAQPLVGYYDSDNAEVVRWHIRLAKAAGIDAFLVSWWGGANNSGRAFEKVILPVAAEEKFQVALCSELAQFHQDVKMTSFNEWPETTVVEPSSSWSDPDLYLRILAEWRGVKFSPPTRSD